MTTTEPRRAFELAERNPGEIVIFYMAAVNVTTQLTHHAADDDEKHEVGKSRFGLDAEKNHCHEWSDQ